MSYPDISRFGITERVLIEAIAFLYAFRFHHENSFVRKATTLVFFLTWAVTTTLLMTGHAVEMWMYGPMTAFVFYIIGREHEAEIQRFLRP